MSNIKFTMKDLDGTVMPYTSFVISTSASANAASFTTNGNGEATVSLAAVSTPYYISKQDGTTESVIAYKFFVPDTTYTLDAELLFVDMGKISKDKNDKSIAALIEAKVVAVNAANRALQVVSLLGDVSTIRANLTNLVQVASNLTNINAVNANATNITTVAGNTANINKVATIDTSVTTVANSQTNVNTVASNIANVNAVAPHTANISTVATNVGSVNTVAGSIASVNTTASNITSVNTVAGNTSNISTVAGISPAVSTIANNITDIQATAEGIGLIPGVLPYTSNITTVANNIAPIVAVGNNINNINEVRAMEADIEVLADEIANIAGAAAAVTQAVDAQKVLYVAGTDYTKNTSNTLVLPYFPAKSNSVKIFFDGAYKNKDTWNRVGKNIAFTSAINADKVEIQYEVPSSFVGLSPEDILVIQNAEAAALASEVDAQQSATTAAVSASLAQGVANQAVDAIKQLFVAGTGFTKGVSTQLTMDFLPVKTNAVKVFFDGVYQNKNTFTRVGKVITFNEVINVDNVEIHYEVPSQFVGLDDDDNAVLVAAQNAAQASANAAAASFDSFDDRYLGAKSIAPTVDNDGNTILVGAKYFNSTENKMYVRNASNVWQWDTATADGVSYLPAGTGAVATDVQSKLRESVSVKDFLCDDGVPVQGNGIHDDYTGIAKAIAYAKLTGAHITAGARDTFYLGTFPNTTGASKFIIDFDNFVFHTNGCKFTVTYNADPVLAASAKMTIFKIFNASNWTFGDFECEADYCERIGTQQGVTAIWVENTTLATNTGTIGVLRGLRLYATLLVTTTDVALRHRGIIAKLLFNNGGYYNLNCAGNGDGVRANIHSNDLVRSYICYGVDDHDVKIYSTNHLKFTDVVVARLSKQPTTRNTTGLKIKYSCPSDLSSSAAITIEHQDIADSGSIENIYIDFDVVKSNPANPTINFASFDITSSPVLRTSTNCVTDNIWLRGKTNSTTPMVIGSAIGGVNGENISRLYVQRHLLNGIANFKRFIVKDSETRYLARSNAADGMSLKFNVSELKFTPNWGLMTVWGANNPGASADEYIIRQYFVLFSVPSTGSTNPLSNTVIATQTAGSLSPTITFPVQTNTFDFAVSLNNYTHANRQCSATLEIYRVL